ncbi:MAG: DNA polymerase III subunit, partial [Sedimentisphaerales bacterium]|nr:DNA polymerase III subunit [Sedimentisphaerales bacterium]
MSLKEIFCQDRAIGILQRALAAERPAHAYIFAGPDGVGRYATARAWARLLLCEKPRVENRDGSPFADSCGACPSCALLDGDSHPDYLHVYKELLEFTKEGKGRKPPLDLPIDVIREFLIEKVAGRPTHSSRKVFVVSEAEKLNVASQNALLKVLEEPPSYCTIVLICTRLEKLLPTTKSRCQIVRFGPIDDERVISALTEMGLGSTQACFFGRLARGSLGLACQWGRLELEGAGLFECKRKIVAALAELELAETLSLADRLLADARKIGAAWADLDRKVSKKDITRRAQKTVIQIIISVFHDVMMHQTLPERPLTHADQEVLIARLVR